MYRCDVCNAKVGPNIPVKRYVVYQNLPLKGRRIVTEVPVCENCEYSLKTGETLSALKRRKREEYQSSNPDIVTIDSAPVKLNPATAAPPRTDIDSPVRIGATPPQRSTGSKRLFQSVSTLMASQSSPKAKNGRKASATSASTSDTPSKEARVRCDLCRNPVGKSGQITMEGKLCKECRIKAEAKEREARRPRKGGGRKR